MRILHLADLHLGSQHDHLGDQAESRRREILDTFRRAISFALEPERGVQCVVIAGNLFETHRPDPETWAFARGLFARLSAAGKPVVVIPGVRDAYAYRDSIYRTEHLPGAHVLTDANPGQPTRIEADGEVAHFYGTAPLPGISPDRFPGFKRSAERGVHIGLLCAGFASHEEFRMRPHTQTVEARMIEESGLHYTALGGYHGFYELPLECGRAAYCGTLEGRRFETGDLGPKSLTIVDVREDAVELSHHPISARNLQSWTLDVDKNHIATPSDLLSSLIARSSEEIMAKVVLTGPMRFLCDLNEIRQRIGARYHYLDIEDRSDLLDSPLLQRIEGERTIRGIFVRQMMAKVKNRLRSAAEGPGSVNDDRALKVARLALKLGLQQFIEEEPAGELLFTPKEIATPKSPETIADSPEELATAPQEKEEGA